MCATCGCGSGEVTIEGAAAHHPDAPAHGHDHGHGPHDHHDNHAHGHGHDGVHEHVHADGTVHRHSHSPAPQGEGTRQAETGGHSHAPGISAGRMVQIEQDILAHNDDHAAHNRERLAERGIFALNLVSSPGSGKTTLLCRTIERLRGQSVCVIEGDQQTSNDADRIRATGAPALQINTGKGCHLDAHMVGQALDRLDPGDGSLLLIENVGNLVCPAGFDLGEAHKVVILSVTEGEDKPLKYPHMFRAASLMILNKIDLLPHLEYDLDEAIACARRVNPQIRILQLSATTGEGMAQWIEFLRAGVAGAAAARAETLRTLRERVARLEARLQP